MTYRDLQEKIKNYVDSEEYIYYGIRHESLKRNIGDVITVNSRHDGDRDDYRDFPSYDSEEYNNLDELDGVSCWDGERYDVKNLLDASESIDDEVNMHEDNLYIIASDQSAAHPNPDYDEILLVNPVVIEIVATSTITM